MAYSAEPVAHSITLGQIADKIKELLADRDVETVVVVVPSGKLEVRRATNSEVEPDGKHRNED